MTGSMRWNIYIGATGAIITFLASFSSNILTTSLLRSLYSFVLLFIVMFAFRWVLGLLLEWNFSLKTEPGNDSSGKGQTIDLITPDDDSTAGQGSGVEGVSTDSSSTSDEDEGSGQFSPLDPPKLATREKAPAEELAKAVRHLSEK